MYWVYILKSRQNDKYYIGHTGDLVQRLLRHNSNREKSTKNRGPWEVIYTKEYITKQEAAKYEYYLKSLRNKSYIQKLISEWRGGSSTG